MTNEELQELAEHVLTGHGPTRVVVSADGEATSPKAARMRGVRPDVIFIREDGWSLGAPERWEIVAYGTWLDRWVGYIRSFWEDARPIESYPGRQFDPVRAAAAPVSVPGALHRDKIAVEYTGPWTVKLTYFKSSGKYYSEGEYTSQKLHLFQIFEEVGEKLARGDRPGLVDGADEFYTLIEVPDHPHAHPALHIPRGR